ncbi:uncharacterized protein LOC111362905 isoform X2 [Spodoptera litura]|uniref:Uncharacterized protein LOC111362905 isoform X2 n=1 Tax=Spodoptera litura TaxID=69820 RepID=A0A9J7EV36_SPOLT|nr:uncharacterized protein LOC111362905 isoform X2 [Spodoptera litura]
MSDEEVTVETSDGQILSAEYKDGQLQIVEVTPFEKDRGSILPDLTDGEENEAKYMQVLDASGKGLVHLDLLNLTLVRCQDGEEGYQLVANAAPSDGEMSSDATVTCVLQTSDTEDPDNQDSYVMVENEDGQNSLVILKSALQQTTAIQKKIEDKKPLSPTEILEKAKSLQKAKALLASSRGRGRGRKRKSDLPPPHELLASPNFKLYLYSCKLCNYKCNAVKDMSAHKLMKHVQEKHLENHTVHLHTEEVEAADVLVCGACGFESGSRSVFRKHIEEEHGATTC